MTPDESARKIQIERAADELLITIESRPDHNAEVAARAIRAAVRFATVDFKLASSKESHQ
jgi:hypothetical protein